MEKTVRRFNSFEESDRANRRYYANMDPQDRLELLLDLLAIGRSDQDEAASALVRTYKIVKLPKGSMNDHSSGIEDE